MFAPRLPFPIGSERLSHVLSGLAPEPEADSLPVEIVGSIEPDRESFGIINSSYWWCGKGEKCADKKRIKFLHNKLI